jgi:hypothetical protein
MKATTFTRTLLAAAAQTVLKFSHTDQPGGARLAGVGMATVVRALIPMMISISILLVVTYIPAISMALVHAVR